MLDIALLCAASENPARLIRHPPMNGFSTGLVS